MGAVCGGLILTRFDMLAFAIVFGLIVLCVSRSLAATAAFGTVLLAMISPWLTVSLLWFGELFHSDSSFVASAVDPRTFATDWYPAAQHAATFRDEPLAWAAKVAGNLSPFVRSAAQSPGLLGSALLAAALGALFVARTDIGSATASLRAADASVRRFAVAAPAIAAPLPLYMVTGYFDERYFSLVFWYVLLALSAWTAVVWARRAGRAHVGSWAMLLALSVLFAGGCVNVARGISGSVERRFPDMQEFAQIEICLRQLGSHPGDRVLFQNDTSGARWAAVRRLPSATLPRNFTRPDISFADKGQFLANYDIRFLVGEPRVLEPIFKPFLSGPPLPCGTAVYRVSPAAGVASS
jgi:hypothetical protein